MSEANCRPFLLLPLLLLFVVLVSVFSRLHYVGKYRDDVQYISTARALAQGQGYLRLHTVQEALQAKYPPAFPYLLVPAQALAPKSTLALQATTALFGGLTLALLWLAFPRWGSALAVLTTLNVAFLSFNSAVMSEIPFTFVTTAFVIWLHRLSSKQALSMLDRVGAAVLICVAFYTRSVGLILLPTLALVLWRKPRDVALIAAYSAGLCLPHVFFSMLQGYQQDLVDYPGLGAVIGRNASFYFRDLPHLLSFADHPDGGLSVFHVLSSAVLLALLLYGLYLCGRSGHAGEAVLCAFTVGTYLVWPFEYTRFMLPILPLLYLALLLAGERLLGKVGVKCPFRVTLIVLVVLQLLYLGREAVQLLNREPDAPPAILTWLEANSDPSDAVQTLHLVAWLEHDRRIVILRQPEAILRNPEFWIEELYLYGADWIVLQEGHGFEHLIALAGFLPQHFKLEQADPEDGAYAFRVVGDGKAALQAVAWYRAGNSLLRSGLSGERQLRQSLRLEPWFPGPRLLLAQYLYTQQRYREAAEELGVLLRQQPRNPEALALQRAIEEQLRREADR